jgi:F-type H+-transporting ATPase subunit b
MLGKSCALLAFAAAKVDSALASSGHANPQFADLTFYWVNFALYVAMMVYILRKPIRNGWAQRAERIKLAVNRSTTDVEAAERELNAIEALTKTLPIEQQRIREQLVEQGNLEADEVIKEAKLRAARIKQQASELVLGETRSAESAFKASLIGRALAIAKERFGKGEFLARDAAYTGRALERAGELVVKH